MTVRELIELLNKQDPEAKVYVYEENDETMGETNDVFLIETEEDLPYVKSDYPWQRRGNEPDMPDHKAVYIA